MIDLISREEALKTLLAYYHIKTITQYSALKEALDRVPSAEPKKGKWEAIDVYEVVVACSECKQKFTYQHNFCPNCGAKMEATE